MNSHDSDQMTESKNWSSILRQGGFMGSEGRCSPVTVTVTGEISILAEGSPYDSWQLKKHNYHELIPHGLILYEIKVEQVDMILTGNQWIKCKKAIRKRPKEYRKLFEKEKAQTFEELLKLCSEGKIK